MRALETVRLRLSPFGMDDLEELHRLVYADPEVAPWWAARTKTLDEVRESFARKVNQRAGQPGFLAVVIKETDELIGLVGLQRFEPDEDTSYIVFEDSRDALRRDPEVIEAELTYALGRAHWGKGPYPFRPELLQLEWGSGAFACRLRGRLVERR